MNNAHDDETPRLYTYEWAAIVSILGFIGMICAVTQISNSGSAPSTAIYDHEKASMTVYIDGAVESPGMYQMPLKSTVNDLLQIAHPAPQANLKKVKLNSTLKPGQRITIAAYPQITIYLEGDVIAGAYQIRKGTRLCDLPSLIAFPPSANMSIFKKKRVLKEGERLIVPKNGK